MGGGGVGSIGPLDDFTWKSVHVSKTLFSFGALRLVLARRNHISHVSLLLLVVNSPCLENSIESSVNGTLPGNSLEWLSV